MAEDHRAVSFYPAVIPLPDLLFDNRAFSTRNGEGQRWYQERQFIHTHLRTPDRVVGPMV